VRTAKGFRACGIVAEINSSTFSGHFIFGINVSFAVESKEITIWMGISIGRIAEDFSAAIFR
jgi:hypothetical protein